ncbi:MAG: phosphopantetheine-binding protein, partial [Limisphaerales bacterium]
LGGHSLLARQVVARAREKFQLELTIASLFENPTIEQFSLFLVNEMLEESENSAEMAMLLP